MKNKVLEKTSKTRVSSVETSNNRNDDFELPNDTFAKEVKKLNDCPMNMAASEVVINNPTDFNKSSGNLTQNTSVPLDLVLTKELERYNFYKEPLKYLEEYKSSSKKEEAKENFFFGINSKIFKTKLCLSPSFLKYLKKEYKKNNLKQHEKECMKRISKFKKIQRLQKNNNNFSNKLPQLKLGKNTNNSGERSKKTFSQGNLLKKIFDDGAEDQDFLRKNSKAEDQAQKELENVFRVLGEKNMDQNMERSEMESLKKTKIDDLKDEEYADLKKDLMQNQKILGDLTESLTEFFNKTPSLLKESVSQSDKVTVEALVENITNVECFLEKKALLYDACQRLELLCNILNNKKDTSKLCREYASFSYKKFYACFQSLEKIYQNVQISHIPLQNVTNSVDQDRLNDILKELDNFCAEVSTTCQLLCCYCQCIDKSSNKFYNSWEVMKEDCQKLKTKLENYWVESQVSPKASSPQSNAQTKMKVAIMMEKIKDQKDPSTQEVLSDKIFQVLASNPQENKNRMGSLNNENYKGNSKREDNFEYLLKANNEKNEEAEAIQTSKDEEDTNNNKNDIKKNIPEKNLNLNNYKQACLPVKLDDLCEDKNFPANDICLLKHVYDRCFEPKVIKVSDQLSKNKNKINDINQENQRQNFEGRKGSLKKDEMVKVNAKPFYMNSCCKNDAKSNEPVNLSDLCCEINSNLSKCICYLECCREKFRSNCNGSKNEKAKNDNNEKAFSFPKIKIDTSSTDTQKDKKFFENYPLKIQNLNAIEQQNKKFVEDFEEDFLCEFEKLNQREKCLLCQKICQKQQIFLQRLVRLENTVFPAIETRHQNSPNISKKKHDPHSKVKTFGKEKNISMNNNKAKPCFGRLKNFSAQIYKSEEGPSKNRYKTNFKFRAILNHTNTLMNKQKNNNSSHTSKSLSIKNRLPNLSYRNKSCIPKPVNDQTNKNNKLNQHEDASEQIIDDCYLGGSLKKYFRNLELINKFQEKNSNFLKSSKLSEELGFELIPSHKNETDSSDKKEKLNFSITNSAFNKKLKNLKYNTVHLENMTLDQISGKELNSTENNFGDEFFIKMKKNPTPSKETAKSKSKNKIQRWLEKIYIYPNKAELYSKQRKDRNKIYKQNVETQTSFMSGFEMTDKAHGENPGISSQKLSSPRVLKNKKLNIINKALKKIIDGKSKKKIIENWDKDEKSIDKKHSKNKVSLKSSLKSVSIKSARSKSMSLKSGKSVSFKSSQSSRNNSLKSKNSARRSRSSHGKSSKRISSKEKSSIDDDEEVIKSNKSVKKKNPYDYIDDFPTIRNNFLPKVTQNDTTFLQDVLEALVASSYRPSNEKELMEKEKKMFLSKDKSSTCNSKKSNKGVINNHNNNNNNNNSSNENDDYFYNFCNSNAILNNRTNMNEKENERDSENQVLPGLENLALKLPHAGTREGKLNINTKCSIFQHFAHSNREYDAIKKRQGVLSIKKAKNLKKKRSYYINSHISSETSIGEIKQNKNHKKNRLTEICRMLCLDKSSPSNFSTNAGNSTGDDDEKCEIDEVATDFQSIQRQQIQLNNLLCSLQKELLSNKVHEASQDKDESCKKGVEELLQEVKGMMKETEKQHNLQGQCFKNLCEYLMMCKETKADQNPKINESEVKNVKSGLKTNSTFLFLPMLPLSDSKAQKPSGKSIKTGFLPLIPNKPSTVESSKQVAEILSRNPPSKTNSSKTLIEACKKKLEECGKKYSNRVNQFLKYNTENNPPMKPISSKTPPAKVSGFNETMNFETLGIENNEIEKPIDTKSLSKNNLHEVMEKPITTSTFKCYHSCSSVDETFGTVTVNENKTSQKVNKATEDYYCDSEVMQELMKKCNFSKNNSPKKKKKEKKTSFKKTADETKDKNDESSDKKSESSENKENCCYELEIEFPKKLEELRKRLEQVQDVQEETSIKSQKEQSGEKDDDDDDDNESQNEKKGGEKKEECKLEIEDCYCLFQLERTKLLPGRMLMGIDLYGENLFGVDAKTPSILTFGGETLIEYGKYEATHVRQPWDLVVVGNHVFITDCYMSNLIHRIDIENNCVMKWWLESNGVRKLSKTPQDTILVTKHPNRLAEYTLDGSLIQEIVVKVDGMEMSHAIKLDKDNFMVCGPNWTFPSKRVCLVDCKGIVKKFLQQNPHGFSSATTSVPFMDVRCSELFAFRENRDKPKQENSKNAKKHKKDKKQNYQNQASKQKLNFKQNFVAEDKKKNLSFDNPELCVKMQNEFCAGRLSCVDCKEVIEPVYLLRLSTGDVMVCDYAGNSIHLISREMQHLRVILGPGSNSDRPCNCCRKREDLVHPFKLMIVDTNKNQCEDAKLYKCEEQNTVTKTISLASNKSFAVNASHNANSDDSLFCCEDHYIELDCGQKYARPRALVCTEREVITSGSCEEKCTFLPSANYFLRCANVSQQVPLFEKPYRICIDEVKRRLFVCSDSPYEGNQLLLFSY